MMHWRAGKGRSSSSITLNRNFAFLKMLYRKYVQMIVLREDRVKRCSTGVPTTSLRTFGGFVALSLFGTLLEGTKSQDLLFGMQCSRDSRLQEVS